jgi:hypothetical protein
MNNKFHCITIGGKAENILHGLKTHHDEHKIYPEIILVDVPRSNLDFLSYSGMEQIKNGYFFSGKYESSEIIMNSPHIICFANELPKVGKLSIDRWKIKEIVNNNLIDIDVNNL